MNRDEVMRLSGSDQLYCCNYVALQIMTIIVSEQSTTHF